MKAGEDPRPDQTRSGKDAHADPAPNETRPAEGGVGTGTKTDPVKAPEPHHGTPKP
jgi:hypothetical protein